MRTRMRRFAMRSFSEEYPSSKISVVRMFSIVIHGSHRVSYSSHMKLHHEGVQTQQT